MDYAESAVNYEWAEQDDLKILWDELLTLKARMPQETAAQIFSDLTEAFRALWSLRSTVQHQDAMKIRFFNKIVRLYYSLAGEDSAILLPEPIVLSDENRHLLNYLLSHFIPHDSEAIVSAVPRLRTVTDAHARQPDGREPREEVH